MMKGSTIKDKQMFKVTYSLVLKEISDIPSSVVPILGFAYNSDTDITGN